MAKIVFDPVDPPTAVNPIPGHGKAPSIELLVAAMRMKPEARQRPWKAENLRLLEEARALIELSLVPAKAKKIGEHISAVMLHYPQRAMSDQERQIVAKAWIEDFGDVPEDILQAACQQWRRSPSLYAPTPGQLLEIAKAPLAARRWWLRFVTETLDRQKAARCVVRQGIVDRGKSQ